jgi:hypothetical protein
MPPPHGYQEYGSDELDGLQDTDRELAGQCSSRRRCLYILSVVFGGSAVAYLLLTIAM